MAIGVARRGARRGGERTLRIPPSCSDPVSHACGPHVASFVRRSSMRALASGFLRAGRRSARRNAKQAERKSGRRNAKQRKKERPAKRRVGALKKKKERCLRTARFEGSGIVAGGSAGKREKQWLAVRGDGES